MKDVARLTPYALLVIGTGGLLVNEFISDWGRVGTLTFAVLNVIGLAILAMMYVKDRDRDKED
jgi:hypothetical protein